MSIDQPKNNTPEIQQSDVEKLAQNFVWSPEIKNVIRGNADAHKTRAEQGYTVIDNSVPPNVGNQDGIKFRTSHEPAATIDQSKFGKEDDTVQRRDPRRKEFNGKELPTLDAVETPDGATQSICPKNDLGNGKKLGGIQK